MLEYIDRGYVVMLCLISYPYSDLLAPYYYGPNNSSSYTTGKRYK